MSQGPSETDVLAVFPGLNVSGETNARGGPGELEPEKQRKITAFQLIFMTYFVTCGGPFGIEPAVEAAGPLYVISALIFISLVWCLPQALFSAELSLMIPENGGCVIWVQHAFGDFWGYVNAQVNLINSIASQAILITLFSDYLKFAMDISIEEQWLLRIGFILVITIINILGVEFISKLSLLFFFFIFSPFVGEFVMIFVMHKEAHIRWDSLAQVPQWKDFEWSLFISTVVWCNGGFDSLGQFAGEVDGASTFVLGVLGSFPLIMFNYMGPIIISYLVFPHFPLWGDDSFVKIAYTQFRPWLGRWMTCASVISNFAQVNSNTAVIARSIWAMSIGKKAGLVEHRYLPFFLSYSYQNRNEEHVPVVAIIFTSVISLLCCFLDRNYLVELYLIIRVVNLLTEYAAFIWLKHKEPDRPRPFEAPFGIVGAILMVIPTLIISTIAIVYADPLSQIIGLIVTVLVGVSYLVKLFWIYITHKYNFCCCPKNRIDSDTVDFIAESGPNTINDDMQ